MNYPNNFVLELQPLVNLIGLEAVARIGGVRLSSPRSAISTSAQAKRSKKNKSARRARRRNR